MHPNKIYRGATPAENISFARERGFGVLSVSPLNADAPPLLSHVPFLLSEDGSHAELHLVRSNPIMRELDEGRPARLAVSGPDGYVSPDWYGIEEQVPTWNYVAVHLTGTLERLPETELRGVLDRLSALFEARLAPKPIWTADKMDTENLSRMMRMIVPCRLTVTGIDGTWKLSQNKSDEARQGAADGVSDSGIGAETDFLAALMRDP